jgi:hypothetical protein
MKKVISIFALFMGINMMSLAQTPTFNPFSITRKLDASHNLVEGQNTVRFSDGSRCKFMFNGIVNRVSQVVLIKKSGKRIALTDVDPAANNPQPPPVCEGNLRCVFNSKYNTYICFCMPDSFTSNTGNDPTAAMRKSCSLVMYDSEN